MIRKFAYNKIFRTTGMLILLLLLVFFPTSKKYSLDEYKTKKVSKTESKSKIYLIDKNNYISLSDINILNTGDEEYAMKVLELLKIDSKYEDLIPNGFKAILPCDLKINTVNINEKDIKIDLSNDFYELSLENEKKAIELITYNMTLIKNIENVYINIEGKELTFLPKSKIYLKQPFKRSDGINLSSELTNYKKNNFVTVYFLNKNKNTTYYVPVTKITSNNEDKIKIIIDELTSSHIYETNLMSFLNYNVKLLSYNIEDDRMTLNFNDYIFDNTDTKKILEEVIYSICMSIYDNYNINEVVFMVNDKEIVKSVLKNIE